MTLRPMAKVDSKLLHSYSYATEVRVGFYSIITLEKQLLIMIGTLE